LRGYIFTEIERKLIDIYLERGRKEQDFYVLLNRINSSYSRLREDMKLLEKILEKESK
jgi:hypothetical protein